jgi:NAD(P)-dependent dehydrogenase (short-subunit alcohol dehydrogenase family)
VLGVVADILVNNAGLTTLGPVAESSPEAELNLIEVDVAAVVDPCRGRRRTAPWLLTLLIARNHPGLRE